MPDAKEPRPPGGTSPSVSTSRPSTGSDALLPLYELPGREPRRSDALRAVVHAGLKVEEGRARRRGRRRSSGVTGNEAVLVNGARASARRA